MNPRLIAALTSAAGLLGVSAMTARAQDAAQSALPLVQRACVGCHAMEVITGQGRSAQAWSDVVDRMADRGVDASDADLARIKAYLAKTYPAAGGAAPTK